MLLVDNYIASLNIVHFLDATYHRPHYILHSSLMFLGLLDTPGRSPQRVSTVIRTPGVGLSVHQHRSIRPSVRPYAVTIAVG